MSKTNSSKAAPMTRQMPNGQWEIYLSTRALGQTLAIVDAEPTQADIDAAVASYREDRARDARIRARRAAA